MKLLSVAGLGIVFAVAAGCHGKEAPPPPPPPPAVVVTPVVQRDVPVFQEWIGTTQGNVNAEIRPQADGYLLRRVYTEGSFVHQGDLMFEIDARQVQAQLQQAQGDLAQAQAQLAKAAAGRQPLPPARRAEGDQPAGARQRPARPRPPPRRWWTPGRPPSHQARLNLGWSRVTAPISGIAGASQAQVGNLVSPSTVLAVVSQCDPIRVAYPLSEQEYLRLQERLRRSPRRPRGQPRADPRRRLGLPPQGASALLGPAGGRQDGHHRHRRRSSPIPGNLLRPGQYAKVRAVTEVKKGALLVPQRAVNELQGGFQVAVVGARQQGRAPPGHARRAGGEAVGRSTRG